MTTIAEKMTSMGTETLEDIRKRIVIPYIRESEEARKMGRTIVNDRLIESESSKGVFPDSLHGEGHDLIFFLDCVYKTMLHDKRTISMCEEMKKEAKLEAELTTAESKLPLYANWRIACSEYLHSLAVSSSQTFEKFIADKNPHKLIGSIMALNLLYKSSSVATHTGKLLAIYQIFHTI